MKSVQSSAIAAVLWLFASAATAAVDPGPCAAAAMKPYKDQAKQRLVIGTGNSGGVYFPYGGGIARIISAKLPKTEMTAEVTGGSVDNLKLLAKHEADVAFTTVDSYYDALRGDGVYKDGGRVPACAIAVLYRSFVHVIARGEAGIGSVADMKGKRVSVGSPGSSTEELANRVLAAAGLDPAKDLKRQFLSVSESTAAMKDGKVDAFFWIGGLPTAAVTDMLTTPNFTAKFIDAGQHFDALKEKHGPVYAKLTMPKGTYPGQATDVPGLGVANLLTVHADMPEKLVNDMLRTLFDNQADVKKVHPEARSFDLESAAVGAEVPFHPAAISFYKAKSVWK